MQWVKNGFVAAPLAFSQRFSEPQMCVRTVVAFVSFCAISSAIYAMNDLCDRRQDQQHPVKRHRPIAAGLVSTTEAVLLSGLLVVVSGLLAWRLGGSFGWIVVVYAVVNVAYSIGIKHMVILDVMAIAAGFVLRILAGSVAISVASSHWLVLCTIMISIFLGFTKRRAEIVAVGQSGQEARKVLAAYSVAFLDQAISVVTGATIICYAIYTVDSRTLREFGEGAPLLLTVPSVMYGMFRYIYIIYHLKAGEDPTSAICKDIPMLVNLVVWGAICLIAIQYGGRLALFG